MHSNLICLLKILEEFKNIEQPALMLVSQTLLANPKGPVEQGNPNTCAETKLCPILFYSGSRSSFL